jgi:hypothetical protein
MSARRTRILVSATAAAALAAGGAAWAASAASAAPAQHATTPTIALYFSGGKSTNVNVLHKKRFGVGDEFILNQPCYNAANHSQKEGNGYLVVTAVSRSAGEATGTIVLGTGDITFTGLLNFSNKPSTFALTGGTGDYSSASGYVTVNTNVKGKNAADVDIYVTPLVP